LIENFKHDYEVCNCKKVTLGELITSINTNKIKTLGQIQDFTTAGTDCRHCIFPETDFGKIKKEIYLKDILKEVIDG